MWDRLLFAMDQYESGQTALEFTAGLATATGTDVRVIHVRELSGLARVPPLETPDEAHSLVEQALFALRLAGVGAEGRACSLPEPKTILFRCWHKLQRRQLSPISARIFASESSGGARGRMSNMTWGMTWGRTGSRR